MTSVKPKETRYLAGFFVPDRSSSFEVVPWQPAVFYSNFCSNSPRASAMPRQVMPLTKTAIGNALAAEEKKRRLSDGGGLYLLIQSDGRHRWRFDYRMEDGRRNTLSLGIYPDVTLAIARSRRDQARQLVVSGIDPGEQRKASKAADKERAANRFEAVANRWLKNQQNHLSEATLIKARWLLDFAIAEFGNRPVSEITPPMVLAACRKLESKGKRETARRVRTKCGQVFRYAVGEGLCERDPTSDLRGLIVKPQVKHRPAITDPEELVQLMRDIYGYGGDVLTCAALRLSLLVFVRPGELRSMKWEDVNLDTRQWLFTPTKTRNQTGVQLIVPLADQAMAILQELQPYTGHRAHVFHKPRNKDGFLSEAAVNSALKTMGYKGEQTAHGFRATGRTILEEIHHYPIELIEMQISHKVMDPLGRAYNRTKHLDKRTEMMQAWADYLDGLRTNGNVVALKAKTG